MGMGDLIMGAMNGGSPASQIANAVSPQQGGTQMPQQPGMAPAAATQSPQDLVQLYAKLMNQSRAANDFDRNMALMAGGFKGPPGGAQTIMNSVAPPQDPGAMLNNLIQLQALQRQNASRPAMIAALTGQGGAGAAGGPSAGVGLNLPPAVAAGMTNEQLQGLAAKQAEASLGMQVKGAETKQSDLLEAQQKAPDQMSQIQQMNQLASSFKNATNADGTPVMQSILGSSAKIAAANKLMGASEPGFWESAEGLLAQGALSPQEQTAIQNLKQLSGQLYSEAFTSTGSRRTQQEVRNLQEGLSPLKNFNQPYQGYMSQFGNFENQLNKSYVNNLGAAGRLDEVPDNLKWDFSSGKAQPLVNSAYLPGGNMYAGTGGGWASSPPKIATIQSPGDIAKLAHGTPFLIPSGPNQGKVGYAQ
jgi:hypothetical protein